MLLLQTTVCKWTVNCKHGRIINEDDPPQSGHLKSATTPNNSKNIFQCFGRPEIKSGWHCWDCRHLPGACVSHSNARTWYAWTVCKMGADLLLSD